jgi:hypothetical protein
MSKEHLATYLNDHLAGSIAALEIVDHLATEAPDLSAMLRTLKKDIEADQRELKTLMDRLHILESRIRKIGGWLSERFTDAKLEVDDESTGPLRRLERLEFLALGIEGKMSLWRALSAAAETDGQLRGTDYNRLADRAKVQYDLVESERIKSAREALSTQR